MTAGHDRTVAGWRRDYQRVAAAIVWLDEHQVEQPKLADVAGALHLSPGHLQRTFTRFAGTSPTRFVRWLTAGAARELLRDRATVVETTSLLGLSSPGRLHDLVVTLDGVTPGDHGRGGEGLTIHVGVHATGFGEALLATTDRGVVALRFLDRSAEAACLQLAGEWPRARVVDDPATTAPVMELVRTALHGARSTGSDVLSGSTVSGGSGGSPGLSMPGGSPGSHVPDASPALSGSDGWGGSNRAVGARRPAPIPVAALGTNLQLKVWEALLRVPADRVTTYGDVARSVGRPDAVRAVASAIGRNPVAGLIPCHRVLRATGELGGYRWGTVRTRAMLAREAARAEP